jgi:hypothetical protein
LQVERDAAELERAGDAHAVLAEHQVEVPSVTSCSNIAFCRPTFFMLAVNAISTWAKVRSFSAGKSNWMWVATSPDERSGDRPSLEV